MMGRTNKHPKQENEQEESKPGQDNKARNPKGQRTSTEDQTENTPKKKTQRKNNRKQKRKTKTTQRETKKKGNQKQRESLT